MIKRIKNNKGLCVLAIFFIVVIVWLIWTNINIATTEIIIQNSKIPSQFDNFRIAQVSDLHNHKWGDKLIDLLKRENPDIIVITGDLVDSSHTDFDIALDFVSHALEIAPVYYVTGNHEAWLTDYGDFEKRLAASGVHILDDKNEWITRDKDKINLAGIKDPDFGGYASKIEAELETLLDTSYYNVVLCHRPELFDRYVNAQADLVISGHAHGGQIRIPFIGGLIAPGQGFFPAYTEGVYSKDNTDMVVSRGLGNSVIPVRVNNMPELILITLEASENLRIDTRWRIK